MHLNVKAMALAFGLLWAGGVLFVGIANMIWPDYGRAFLEFCASIYPGYSPGTGLGSIVAGTLYGLADGTIGGALLAWLYNLCAKSDTA